MAGEEEAGVICVQIHVLPKPFSLEEVERVLRRVAAAIDPGLRAA